MLRADLLDAMFPETQLFGRSMPGVAMEFEKRDSLPRLAWCAVEEKGTILIRHGPWVEVRDDFFVEGAWDGPFEAGDFDRSPVFVGSGGRVREGQMRFCTPCTPLEYLFQIRQQGRRVISNSLAFALIEAGLSLDRSYPYYRRDLWSCNLGLNRRKRTIPTSEGPPVELLLYFNGDKAKPEPPTWHSFEDYETQLLVWLRALTANAAWESRAVRYRPFASISSGYDSAAAVTLSSEAGLKDAFTFRQGIDYPGIREVIEDSGASLARKFGVHTKEIDAGGPLLEEQEAEFAACGDGFDLQLGQVAPHLEQVLFITGFRGDTFWERTPSTVSSSFESFEPIATSLGEFRLRTGFLHLPVPVLGGVRQPDLHRIANSAAMKPWSIGGGYDRPIPRRILESRGVQRGTFARVKCGSWACLQFGPWHASQSREFEKYYAAHGPGPLTWLRQYLRYLWARLSKRSYFQRPFPGRHTLLVQWGTEVMQERYREALKR